MRYNDAYINDVRDLAEKLELNGHDVLKRLTNAQIRKCINGIGSEAMPKVVRKALDALHPSLVIASHCHDCQWQYDCDGGRADFLRTNADFERNGIIMAKYLYSWYNPARYIAILNARRYRKILDDFGWPAYKASFKV